MSMTVLNVAFPFAPVGRCAVGGAEQVLSDLDEALAVRGHRSLVVACEESTPAGELFGIPLPRHEVLDGADRLWCRKQFQAAIDRALRSYPVDLIHMHGLDFAEYTLPAEIPVLVTLHLPIPWYGPEIWKTKMRRGVQFCCVSEMQRSSCPAGMGEVTVVENGVALPPFTKRPKEDFALVLGRICPEKNAHAALEAGSLAGMRVLLGGRVFPYEEHRRYFAEKIAPLLLDGRHEFLGPVAPSDRQDLLGRAKCLLHPTLAPETSSLVAMEAIAAGTPVIAYGSGALPEIVEDGVTGFLVNNVGEMAGAIRKVDEILPERCRAAAERRFGKERMVQRYFDLYAAMHGAKQGKRSYA